MGLLKLVVFESVVKEAVGSILTKEFAKYAI